MARSIASQMSDKKTQQTKRLIEGCLTVIFTTVLLAFDKSDSTNQENYESGKKLAKQTVTDFADALEEK